MPERILTDAELAEREAVYHVEDDWDSFIEHAINQEPALLARLREAERLLKEEARWDDIKSENAMLKYFAAVTQPAHGPKEK